MANMERIQALLDFIETNPEKHDQSTVMNQCGTAGCLAGWAVHFYGDASTDEVARRYWARTGYTETLWWLHEGARLLDLDVGDADVLFSANNTREMLKHIVKDIANGEKPKDVEDYITQAHGSDDAWLKTKGEENRCG